MLSSTPSPIREIAATFVVAPAGAALLWLRDRQVRVDADSFLILNGALPREVASGSTDIVSIAIRCDVFDETMSCAVDGGFLEHLRPIRSDLGQALLAVAAGSAGAGGTESSSSPQRLLAELAIVDEARERTRAQTIPSVKAKTRSELLKRVLLATDFILSHFEQTLSLDDIARAASLSRFHFARLFRSVHGVTPYAYLLSRRAKEAALLLDSGDCASSVAPRVGLRCAATMHRLLRGSPGAGKRADRLDFDARSSSVRSGRPCNAGDGDEGPACPEDAARALTPSELIVFRMLAARPGEPVRRDEIASRLRALGAGAASRSYGRRSVDMHVSRIRRKISGSRPSMRISCRHGFGYFLELHAPPDPHGEL
jgi:AraC-like DNA-binding protein